MNYIFFIALCIEVLIYPFKKLRQVSIIFVLLTFLIIIVFYPKDALSSARDGINLWLNIVIPSLFPFFIINDMLIGLKVPENISSLLKPAAKFLFNTSGYGAYSYIMSIFAGYPSGAKIVSELIKDKKITPIEGQKILTFSSTSGPLFIIGAVGTGMLGSAKAGYILFASHIAGSILNGIFSRLFFRQTQNSEIHNYVSSSNNFSKGDLFSYSIISSIYTCGIIGGYIIIFSTIIKLMDSISFFKIIGYILKTLLNLSNSTSEAINIFMKSLFEISNGCQIISLSSSNMQFKLILISFIISFSGLSVIGQVSSIINNTGLKTKTYIFFKITQGILSAISCSLLMKTNFSIPTFYMNIQNTSNLKYNTFTLIGIYLILILFLNIIGSIFKNRKLYKKQ